MGILRRPWKFQGLPDRHLLRGSVAKVRCQGQGNQLNDSTQVDDLSDHRYGAQTAKETSFLYYVRFGGLDGLCQTLETLNPKP